MDLLVTYDINTTTPEGVRRLRQVAKACEGIGERVQQSVFELAVSEPELAKITYGLRQLINAETDSVRFYSYLPVPSPTRVTKVPRPGHLIEVTSCSRQEVRNLRRALDMNGIPNPMEHSNRNAGNT